MTEELKKELDDIFAAEKLEEEAKAFWFDRLTSAPEEMVKAVIFLFRNYPGSINWFGLMQVRKEEALANNDHEAWKAIIEEEKEYFGQSLSFNEQ